MFSGLSKPTYIPLKFQDIRQLLLSTDCKFTTVNNKEKIAQFPRKPNEKKKSFSKQLALVFMTDLLESIESNTILGDIVIGNFVKSILQLSC